MKKNLRNIGFILALGAISMTSCSETPTENVEISTEQLDEAIEKEVEELEVEVEQIIEEHKCEEGKCGDGAATEEVEVIEEN